MLGAFRQALEEATEDLGLETSVIDAMVRHWGLLMTWNQRVNLTAIREPEEAAWLHYRDSLEALRFLPDGAVADIGSGGGFPGIPLAIASPDQPFTLVEPRRKRASFLSTAVGRLGLTNVSVLQSQSTCVPMERFAGVVTRATFSRPQDLSACLEWLEPGGALIAFRGVGESSLQGEKVRYELRGSYRWLEIVRK